MHRLKFVTSEKKRKSHGGLNWSIPHVAATIM